MGYCIVCSTSGDFTGETYNCRRCGSFKIAPDSESKLDSIKGGYRWAIVSHAISRMKPTIEKPFVVTSDWLDLISRVTRLPTPTEQANTFIKYLAEADVPYGQPIYCDQLRMAAVMGTGDTENYYIGFRYIIKTLTDNGYIEEINSPGAYRLTFKGWEYFSELERGLVEANTAFMAMDFHNQHTAEAFQNFCVAVKQTGFDLKRLDQNPKAGLIDLRMRVEIRSAKFLIADLTEENRGAYWEAGFAEGLGKQVYYTCEKVKFEEMKTHFDTEHLYTVKWDKDNLKVACDELKAAIRNDFPIDAIQTDEA